MKIERHKIPERPVNERIKDFEEVALGYTIETAIEEAQRCIQCQNPKCVGGCPVEIDIPAFLKLIAAGDMEGAIRKIKEKNSLPAVCGRVCPQEDQCEKVCILGIKGKPVAVGALERFVADQASPLSSPSPTASENSFPSPSKMERGVPMNRDGVRIAVVGSGPAGLTCAGDLAKLGYQVTLFESLSTPGGVLVYGIPEFRLPKKIVEIEIDYVRSLGVELITDVLIGKTITIEELFAQGFKAVFIGSGAGLPQFLGVPGENLLGVYSANEFLSRVNLMKAYKFPEYLTPVKVGKKVAVLGAGNVAMDAARVSLRLGAKEVTIVYRRSRKEMPARAEEIERAEEEGIVFKLLTAPTEIRGDKNGWVQEMECLEMELGEPDASGRRRPVPKEGSEFVFPVDTIISAIGNKPNPLIPRETLELKVEKWGGVIINESTRMTSIPGVFAGGDIVRGAATVISAMGDGKKAAEQINAYLSKLGT
ncbi:NADPH-dependent glutamate synthase [Candidatus Saganbacteria bacterium]|nr:NADPH-dependent glutamate synthase [Candidatus Saganbacteria bacterium]